MNRQKKDKFRTNRNSKYDGWFDIKTNQDMDYFIAGSDNKAKMVASAKTTQEYGIGHFKGTHSLQVKEGVKSYQALPRHLAYILK